MKHRPARILVPSLAVAAILAMTFVALPAQAQDAPPDGACDPGDRLAAAVFDPGSTLGLGSAAADQARKKGDLGDAEAQSTCTAQCADGSSVTCSGSSCSAYDTVCNPRIRGYCTGSVSGPRYCPRYDCEV